MDDRTLAWQVSEVTCYVLHSADAGSYEVQIRDRGTVIARRWFSSPSEADAFVADAARDQHAVYPDPRPMDPPLEPSEPLGGPS